MEPEDLKKGVEHFNFGEFFEAHELWEDVWRATPGKYEKLFIQGLIQVAVALHHHSTGNLVGAESLLRRAIRNLDTYPHDFYGVDRGEFSASITAWLRALQEGSSAPPLPRVLFMKR